MIGFGPIVDYRILGIPFIALIPLTELCDAHVMKKYGTTPDAEETLRNRLIGASQKRRANLGSSWSNYVENPVRALSLS
ncbi:hypothetical protein Tco_1339399 [Tanacetum coccineum]